MTSFNSTLPQVIMSGVVPNYTDTQVYTGWCSAGYNIYYLSSPMKVPKNSLAVGSLSGGASFLINRNAAAVHSDFNFTRNSSLNTNTSDPSKWCFYVNLITVGTVNRTINIAKNYTSPGSFNLSVTAVCNGTMLNTTTSINVTEGKNSRKILTSQHTFN